MWESYLDETTSQMSVARPRVEVSLDRAGVTVSTTKASQSPDGLLAFAGRALTCGMIGSSESFSFPAVAPTTSELPALGAT